MLIKYFEHRVARGDSFLKGKHLIELGCGTGAVGIAAAMLGANVLLTDQAQLQDLIDQNRQFCLQKNPSVLSRALQSRELDWGKHQVSEEFDFVVVSDCVLPKLYPIEPLVQSIDTFCTNNTRVYMSYEYRYHEPYNALEKCIDLLSKCGFEYRIVDELHPDYTVEDIQVYELWKSSRDAEHVLIDQQHE